MAIQQSLHSNKKVKLSRNHWILILGIFFIASTLRSPITSVGPIVAFIRDSLDISNVLAGFLTTIPLLAFAIVSPFAPKISHRFGLEKTLFVSMIFLTVGIVIRSIGSTPLLLVGTFLLGCSIAFGNVLLPALIKLKFPLQIGILTGIYSVSMNLTGSIAAGISVPIADTKMGWEGALGSWAILSILALIVWLPQLKSKKSVAISHISTERYRLPALWRSPLAWHITIFMGLQSFIFYTTFAWMPEILKLQGMSANHAGWMLSLSQFAQLPMTFIVPIIAGRLRNQRLMVIIIAILYFIGFGGIIIGGSSFVLLSMIFLGLAGGSAFGLAMMFFTLRTQTHHEAAEMSGMAQSFGYILAATGPVLFGFLHDLTGSWSIPLSLFFITTTIWFLSGLQAGKNQFVLMNEPHKR